MNFPSISWRSRHLKPHSLFQPSSSAHANRSEFLDFFEFVALKHKNNEMWNLPESFLKLSLLGPTTRHVHVKLFWFLECLCSSCSVKPQNRTAIAHSTNSSVELSFIRTEFHIKRYFSRTESIFSLLGAKSRSWNQCAKYGIKRILLAGLRWKIVFGGFC